MRIPHFVRDDKSRGLGLALRIHGGVRDMDDIERGIRIDRGWDAGHTGGGVTTGLSERDSAFDSRGMVAR